MSATQHACARAPRARASDTALERELAGVQRRAVDPDKRQAQHG